MTTPSPHLPIAIDARNLNLSLGGKTLLENFSIQLRSGELTALLGPNGAGKSSLLKVLCGEIEAGGKTYYFDHLREQWSPKTLARHLGVLPQHSGLTFAFSAQEVVQLGGMPLDLPNTKCQAVAEASMTRVDVNHLAHRLYPSLSGGEKQRVHFARVLTQLSEAGHQCILMLDEPTSALDLAHQHNTLQVAKDMAKSGAAVVVVIHDLNLASQYADRLVIMNHGRIQADGNADQVLTSSNIERVYGWRVSVMPHPVYGYPIVIS